MIWGRRLRVLAAGLALTLATAGCTPPAGAGLTERTSVTYPRANDTVGLTELDGLIGPGYTRRKSASFGGDRLSVDAGSGTPVSRFAEVFYPAGSASLKSAGTDASVEGGAQAYYDRVAGPLDEAYLRYWVYFPEGFDFVKGGKMPGLFGGTQTSGGKIPDGSNGFSTRYMWREGGAGEVYAYLPSSIEHGTSLGRGDWSFPTGRWSCMVQHVRLNTPNGSDGLVVVEQDGRTVSTQHGLIFRTSDQLKIDGIFFSSFFGGGDATWASPTDQFARFGGIEMSASKLTCS